MAGQRASAQQIKYFLDQEVDLHRGTLVLGLTAKSEDLLHEVLGAVPGGEHSLQILH
jgi:hypothetical protein